MKRLLVPREVLIPAAVFVGLLIALAGILAIAQLGVGELTYPIQTSLFPPEFKGNVMDPAWQAGNFSLVDQKGARFELVDTRGEVVVLTFLYTSCTDVCPFIGAKLREVSQELGDARDEVELVVISVDPERDTLERRAAFSQTLGLFDRWHYLSGREQDLQPVWEAYFIGPAKGEEDAEKVSEETLREYGLLNGLSDDNVAAAKQTIEFYGGGYDVSHSAPVWLIDRGGTVRVMHGQDLLPSELVHDIRILLGERD